MSLSKKKRSVSEILAAAQLKIKDLKHRTYKYVFCELIIGYTILKKLVDVYFNVMLTIPNL